MTIKARSIIFKDVLISTDFDTIKNIVGYQISMTELHTNSEYVLNAGQNDKSSSI